MSDPYPIELAAALRVTGDPLVHAATITGLGRITFPACGRVADPVDRTPTVEAVTCPDCTDLHDHATRP